MKYTRNESGEVIPVKGCTTCPHVASIKNEDDGWNYLYCKSPTLRPDGKLKPSTKKLVGRWEGPYHASCLLASVPENVPAAEVKK